MSYNPFSSLLEDESESAKKAPKEKKITPKKVEKTLPTTTTTNEKTEKTKTQKISVSSKPIVDKDGFVVQQKKHTERRKKPTTERTERTERKEGTGEKGFQRRVNNGPLTENVEQQQQGGGEKSSEKKNFVIQKTI